jgi:BirA family biotin operon repressor/biotin-[acetyl-CoA-carboxylase] ligase
VTRPLEDAELLPLLDALADGRWHSGEALAEVAGISRAALAKRIARLEEWDLDIEARSGLGYRLAVPLERLDEARIREALPAATRSRLRELEVALRIDSTNQALLDAAPARDPQALFAEAQTAGRGRRGRAWRSPFGANRYLSLAWRFPAWPPQLGTLSLAVGVACARALRAAGVAQIGLKWPNDLRVGNDKLGGILIEQRGEAGGDCRVVVGVGLNIAMSAAQAASVDQPWTSVQAVLGDAAPSRNALAALLLDALLSALIEFEAQGFAGFIADWNRLDLSAGRPVRIEGAGAALEGIACGIDESGALIVESGGRRHHLHAGEVSLRLAAP